MELNPGSPSMPSGGDLLHVRALGDNDTLHFLFCSQGAPTLLLVHTNTTTSTVKVDWDQFVARNTTGSLRVEPESSILYSSALVISRLLEYNDVNDTAVPTSDLFPPYDLQNFIWARLQLSAPSAQLCGTPNSTTGSLCVELTAFETEGRNPRLPRLLHNTDSSQLMVSVDGLLPRASRSRFLLEVQAVGGASSLRRVDEIQSIDDEFTPSIFKMYQWVSSVNGSSDVLGFVQWKPVAYRKADATLEDATPSRHSSPEEQNGTVTAVASGLIRAFYGESPETFGLNVSFGLSGDPFYNSTRFLSWTLLMGVGSPPVESFSPLVIIIMAAGLGAPLVLMLVGGIVVCVRKKTAASSMAYEPIN